MVAVGPLELEAIWTLRDRETGLSRRRDSVDHVSRRRFLLDLRYAALMRAFSAVRAAIFGQVRASLVLLLRETSRLDLRFPFGMDARALGDRLEPHFLVRLLLFGFAARRVRP